MTTRTWTLAVLIACGGTEGDPGDQPDTETEAPPPLPAEAWGAYGVGTEVDAVPARGGEELPLQVWWPSETTDGEKATYEGTLVAEAQLGVAVACPAPLPVVLFSHGNGGLRYQSVFLTEHLASHGYLVAAPDHVGNTTFDASLTQSEVAPRRPLDIADTFDHLIARSADPDDPLAGCVDPDAGYAIMGHSFGGWTTLVTAGAPIDLEGLTETCDGGFDFLCGLEDTWYDANPGDDSGEVADERVWAAIPLAPVGIGSLGGTVDQIEVPTLIIGGRIDILTPWDIEVKPLYQELVVEPRGLAGIHDAGHYHFTDFCIEGLFPGCGADYLPLEDAHLYINGLVVSWLRLARGEPGYEAWVPADDPGLSWRGPDVE